MLRSGPKKSSRKGMRSGGDLHAKHRSEETAGFRVGGEVRRVVQENDGKQQKGKTNSRTDWFRLCF